MEKLTPAMLIDKGICPTCYDKEHNHCLYGNNEDKMLYKNELFECFLVGNPRADGHTIISSQKHYKDMMEIPAGEIDRVHVAETYIGGRCVYRRKP